MSRRELTPLDRAFGMDVQALATSRLHDPDFSAAERAKRRAVAKRQRASRKANR